jgi:hypothetical protein
VKPGDRPLIVKDKEDNRFFYVREANASVKQDIDKGVTYVFDRFCQKKPIWTGK